MDRDTTAHNPGRNDRWASEPLCEANDNRHFERILSSSLGKELAASEVALRDFEVQWFITLPCSVAD